MPLPKPSQTKAPSVPKKDLPPLLGETAPPTGFREQAQAPMKAWDTPGQETIGYLVGMRESAKYPGRQLVDLVDDDGIVTTWPCPIMLEQALRGLTFRTIVSVRYRGEEASAKGSTKHFQVFVLDEKAR